VQTKLHWYIIPIYPALSILVGWAMSKLFRRYSTAIVLILVIPALIYLATLKKGIFNLDYSPDTKKMFLSVSNIIPEGEKIFMYKIDDPGVLFYFYGISKNIWQPEDLEDILGQKDKYILFTKPGFNDLTQRNFTVIYDNPSFIVVKTR
jgi:4-amino-4-deoxy-L-arabinose transferase-like glycosyltransferase